MLGKYGIIQTKAQKGPKFDIITVKMRWPIKKKVDIYGIV